jgi:hypothetical protein
MSWQVHRGYAIFIRTEACQRGYHDSESVPMDGRRGVAGKVDTDNMTELAMRLQYERSRGGGNTGEIAV